MNEQDENQLRNLLACLRNENPIALVDMFLDVMAARMVDESMAAFRRRPTAEEPLNMVVAVFKGIECAAAAEKAVVHVIGREFTDSNDPGSSVISPPLLPRPPQRPQLPPPPPSDEQRGGGAC